MSSLIPRVDGILESCLYASDLAAAEWFYGEVLRLSVHSREAGRHVFFRCGSGMFLVFAPEHTGQGGAEVGGVSIPAHGASGAGHVAFSVSAAALPAWKARLGENGIGIEAEVHWPGGGESLYVRDPAGNSVELATPALWTRG